MKKVIYCAFLMLIVCSTHSAHAVRESSGFVHFDRFQIGIESAAAVRRHDGWNFLECDQATVAIIPSDASNADAIFSIVQAAYYANIKINIFGECDSNPMWINIDYIMVDDKVNTP